MQTEYSFVLLLVHLPFKQYTPCLFDASNKTTRTNLAQVVILRCLKKVHNLVLHVVF